MWSDFELKNNQKQPESQTTFLQTILLVSQKNVAQWWKKKAKLELEAYSN